MRVRYQNTLDTTQGASAEKTRVWVACALAATRKQLADEKLEWPGLFKEALLGDYRERAIYEKPPSLIVVELEHPHFLSKVAWVSHQLPQEVSTFEFEKTESGTLFYGKEPPRPRRQGSTLVPVPMPPKEIEHVKFCRVAAWLRALDWWCQQLEWRLQPPEVGSVLVPSAAVNEAEATEAPADNQPTEEALGETTESGLPKIVLKGKRCAKVIDEVSRIKNFHASGGRKMKEIREEWPNYEVWRIVEQLPQEDQETFEKPGTWGAKIGYARLILSKHYGNSPDTINDWVKAYKKHERSKNRRTTQPPQMTPK